MMLCSAVCKHFDLSTVRQLFQYVTLPMCCVVVLTGFKYPDQNTELHAGVLLMLIDDLLDTPLEGQQATSSSTPTAAYSQPSQVLPPGLQLPPGVMLPQLPGSSQMSPAAQMSPVGLAPPHANGVNSSQPLHMMPQQ